MKTKRVIVKIDWRSEDSISRAEREKTNLENQGYTLINQMGVLDSATLIYQKDV